MKLSLEQVRHVAGLARLKLTPEEEERYRLQLSAILDSMDLLNELDLTGVAPMSHGSSTSGAARDDVVSEQLSVERGLANAPERSGTSFAIPKVIE